MAEEVPALDQFPLEELLSIYELIYQPGTLDVLMGHLDKCLAAGTPNPDLCSAILRLYLLYPQCADAEVLRKILIQSIVALPENHFDYYACLIPTHFPTPEAAKRVTDVVALQELLVECKIKEAWERLREPDMSDLLHAPGLVDAVRRFALDVVGLSCSTISLTDFAQLLNIGPPGAQGLEDKVEKITKTRGWSIEDVAPGCKAVRVAAARDAEGAKPASTRAAVAHRTVEKYLSPEGLQQCLSVLRI